MKIIAKRPVELGDHIYRKGEGCEWSGPIDERIAANFAAEDGSPLVPSGASDPDAEGTRSGATGTPDPAADPAAKIAKTVASLKRDGIMRKLDAMGVAYSTKANTESLAKTLLVALGEIE